MKGIEKLRSLKSNLKTFIVEMMEDLKETVEIKVEFVCDKLKYLFFKAWKRIPNSTKIRTFCGMFVAAGVVLESILAWGLIQFLTMVFFKGHVFIKTIVVIVFFIDMIIILRECFIAPVIELIKLDRRLKKRK